MSRYSQKEQANIIGIAAELEAAIATEKEELNKLQSQRFKEAPKRPELEFKSVEPEPVKSFRNSDGTELGINNFVLKKRLLIIVLTVIAPVGLYIAFCLATFNSMFSGPLNGKNAIVGLILGAICVAGWIWAFIQRKKLIQQYNAATEELKKKKKQEADQKNEELKAQFEAQRHNLRVEYDNVMKSYNSELAVWQESQNSKIAFVQDDLMKNEDALNTLYSSTQLIPSTYRTVERLTWLYEDMSTSEHDIERSIDLLNSKEIKEELIHIQDHVNNIRRDMQEGFIGIYSAIQEGNAIQSEMLSNLEGIRTSAKIGNFMNAGSLIQNHNRNKTLSQINNKIPN